nr:hypothetical protein GCM10020063_005630 [Dactylosporangium thailandense]
MSQRRHAKRKFRWRGLAEASTLRDQPRHVAGARYWATLVHDRRLLGCGFFVSRGELVTAAHCLRGLPVGTAVTVEYSSGSAVGHIEQITDGDLALVVLPDDVETEVIAPMAVRCDAGDRWFAPYRPKPSDPQLEGTVTTNLVDYESFNGTKIRAIQLHVTQALGGYAGYSGGPVQKVDGNIGSAAEPVAIAGVLLEQYPERHPGGRASNVLFAASLLHAFVEFDRFRSLSLVPGPRSSPTHGSRPREAPRPSSPPSMVGNRAREVIDSVELTLRAIRRWEHEKLIDPGEVPILRSSLLRQVIRDEGVGDRIGGQPQ